MAPTNILSLPNETLVQVARYLRKKHVLSLRLTCRSIQQVTTPVFGAAFMTERAFTLSKTDVEKLLAFSEGPYAQYLRVLIIKQGGGNRVAKYHGLLLKAFRNFANFGRLNTLGVRRIYAKFNYEEDTTKAYENILRFFNKRIIVSARKAGLQLSRIIADFEESPYRPTKRPVVTGDDGLSPHAREAQAAATFINHIQDQFAPNIALTLRCITPDGSARSYPQMTLHRQTNTLEATGLSLHHVDDFDQWWHESPALQSLSIINCKMDYQTLCDTLKRNKTTLRSIRLEDIRLYRNQKLATYDEWHAMFCQLWSEIPLLSHCRVGRLWKGDYLEYVKSVWEVTDASDIHGLLEDLAGYGVSKRRFLAKS